MAPYSANETILTSVEFARVRLREAIVSGRFAPGERLVETNLAQELGVSRGPVRDALRDLASEGLVVLRRNRGAVVAEIHVEDVLEVYAIRAALGTLALRQLMSSSAARTAVLPILKEQLKKAKSKEGRDDQQSFVEADTAFQIAIAVGSGLRRVGAMFAQTSAEAKMFVSALRVHYHGNERRVDELEAIYNAIADGDLPTAERVWQTRFRAAAKEFVEAIAFGPRDATRWPHLFQMVEDPEAFFSNTIGDRPKD
ncbi:GntR family transcriptional regulator [Acuticoccus mangrovi]|uniref:GntR family transcriptional regulator n=1 Tax=Acuticoccus mangrovi TaxID=2796142 RepID=A0A934MG50_9HYPH|nr:GntR family transcriptional regulator [Acuticoccus mangrovi]MBJ3775600.1 GntR family transcriptional regulator [Acuticoccus mangrovi]